METKWGNYRDKNGAYAFTADGLVSLTSVFEPAPPTASGAADRQFKRWETKNKHINAMTEQC